MYVIYGLVDKEGQVYYVGHTKDIKDRVRCHKKDYKNENRNHYNYPVYKHIRDNNLEINYVILEEKINEEDKRKKEREWYQKYDNLCNVDTPNRSKKEYQKEYYEENKETIKEYRENNKEKISEYNKEYREKNKETIKANKNQLWTCEICNKQLHGHRSRHLKLHNN